MITLTKLDRNNLDVIRPYIKRYGGIFNDLTLGTRFMWGDEFGIEYAVVNDTLIMRETFSEHSSFYYPLGEDVATAVSEIERYCKETGKYAVVFGCLSDVQTAELLERYAGAKVHYYRDWCDYVYPAEQFKTYAGKKLAGQRNHVNKFKRLYQGYKVRLIVKDDIPAVKEFLREYEKENEMSDWAAEEEPRVYELLDNMGKLDQFGIIVTVGGKIISLAIGEIVGDTLFEHVEKGLKSYEGVYPFTAQEFAKAFATGGVTKINREEDCGDLGLRTSKMQYHPSEIRAKNYVTVRSSFFNIVPPVCFATERLTVTDILREDGKAYAKLYTDDKINEFYGYDYRQDLGNNQPNGDYFFKFMSDLKAKKEEYSLAVRLGDKMIGEIVF